MEDRKLKNSNDPPQTIMQGIKSDNNDKKYTKMVAYYGTLNKGFNRENFIIVKIRPSQNKKLVITSIHPRNNIKN